MESPLPSLEQSEMKLNEKRKQKQLILFPTPLQGHITPMLQLATVLSSAGFSVSVVHPQLNSPNPSSYPDLRFEPISDGIPSELASDEDFMLFSKCLNENCEAPFRECVGRLVSEADSSNPVVGLIDDGQMAFVAAVAQDLKLPRILLFINSAAAIYAYLSFPLLGDRGYFPIQDPTSEALIPELPPLRVKDLPDIGSNDPEAWFRFVSTAVKELMDASSAVIWNTFEALEGPSLLKFKQAFKKPVFAIGPFHKHPSATSSSLILEDRSCMAWLDKQPPNSVIYVSFGSLASVTKPQLYEAARGLANSKLPFLWAVRPGALRESGKVDFPNGFKEEIEGRGIVTTWVPHIEVLGHPAVGGFWTHCGWNSTLESICEGVPMLRWPRFGDQRVNARYATHVWKVGLQLECRSLERGDIEKGIRRLMMENEGADLRERASALKELAAVSLKMEGPTYHSFLLTMQHIPAN